MSFFEIFAPGLRHMREQKEFDKVRVLESEDGQKGLDRRHGIDLAKGTAVIRPRKRAAAAEPDSVDEE